jgi:hypothetical protein
MTQHVPGFGTDASSNGFDIVQVGSQVISPVETSGIADAALVKTDAPEPGEHRCRRGLHVVGHSRATVQQKQWFAIAIVIAPPHRKASSRSVHTKLIHQNTVMPRPRRSSHRHLRVPGDFPQSPAASLVTEYAHTARVRGRPGQQTRQGHGRVNARTPRDVSRENARQRPNELGQIVPVVVGLETTRMHAVGEIVDLDIADRLLHLRT